jgi:hypothetical protein
MDMSTRTEHETAADLQRLRDRHERNRLALEVERQEAEIEALRRTQCLDRLEASFYDPANYVDLRDYLPGGYNGIGNLAAFPTTRNDRDEGRNFPFFRTEIELAQIRGAARLLATGNENAVGVLNHLTNYVLGTGFKYHAVPKKAARPDAALIARVQQTIENFLEHNLWTGNLDRELFRRRRRDGERFLGLWHTGAGRVEARTIEPDQVTEPGNQRQIEDWLHSDHDEPTSWSFGVHSDERDVQNVHGYYVQWSDNDTDWDYLPGGNSPIFPPLGANAQDHNAWLEHDKSNVDRVVKRGLSDFFCGQATLELARKLLRNIGEGASLQAAIAWIREVVSGTGQSQVQAGQTLRADAMFPSSSPTGGRMHYVQQYDPGTILTPAPGTKYVSGPMGSERAPSFLLAHAALLRNFAVRWGLPEHMVTGSAENNNYASILEAGSPFHKACEAAQSEEKQSHSRVLWRVVWFAWSAGVLGDIPWPKLRASVDIQIEPPQIEIRDADKETERRKTMFDAGILSRKTWQLQEDLDPDQEEANMRKNDETQAEEPE